MLKKLMITTALSGLMVGAAFAQSSPSSEPADRSASPPAATQSSPSSGSSSMPSSPSGPPATTQSTPSSPPAASPPAPDTRASTPAPDTRAAAPSAPTAPKVVVVNSQKPEQFLASKFKGTDVIGADNQKIGDVSDILFDKSGKIDAFIVSVGGFLGMGAKDVALAPNAFEVVTGDKSKNESDKLKVSMTKDELKQAANFEPYTPPRTTTGMGGSTTGGSPRPAPAPQR